MERRKLTEAEMLKGTTNAIAALRKKKKGPVWLIPVLEKRRDALQAKLGNGKNRTLMPRAARGSSRGSAKHAVAVALLALSLLAAYAFLPSRRGYHAQSNVLATQFCLRGTIGPNLPAQCTIVPSSVGGIRLYSLAAFCASAGPSTLRVNYGPSNAPGATALWFTATGDIGTTLASYYFPTPLTIPAGNVAQVQLDACGPGNFATLEVQYSVQ